ncbi:hypothetical protein BH18ACT12_BH18ACT12_01440 [soil metagenome]
MWLQHQAKLAEALGGSVWSELMWAARVRHEFIRYLENKGATLVADN